MSAVSGHDRFSTLSQSNTAGTGATAARVLPRVRTTLHFYFALLVGVGGLVLATGQGIQSVGLLAVGSAVFGFVFVDWLRWFELPPIGAYLAMAAAAFYCVFDFWNLQHRGESQMASVALLLVLVQAILMLQYKSRRILEQLAVFSLLELVVAAIFSDAISFGLVILPIGLVGGFALSLLSWVTTMENVYLTLDAPQPSQPKTRIGRLLRLLSGHPDETRRRHPLLASACPDGAMSIQLNAKLWSRFSVITLTPAVILVSIAFFYLVPRKVQPSRAVGGGPALVGFDDEIHLEQLGQVMQNSVIAAKVKLRQVGQDRPYQLVDSLYLRGKVLESYEVDYSNSRPIARWISLDPDSLLRRRRLPQSIDSRDFDRNRPFDQVDVEIVCKKMNRPALFSIPPYFDNQNAPQAVHALDRWTLSRRDPSPPFGLTTYGFQTHAFSDGVQTRWLSHVAEIQRRVRGFGERRWATTEALDYRTALLKYRSGDVPSALTLATKVIEEVPPSARTQPRIASQMERFLATSPRFSYTLKLDSVPIPGTDPMEQFLSVDKKGHCQYFASALALMLRSVEIPSRVVVGYRSNEFNEIGGYHVVRQSHAHAWVEALIDANELPAGVTVPGQPKSAYYWMRLDPTPALSSAVDNRTSRAGGIVNLANLVWEDFVVDLDRERQQQNLVDATGLSPVKNSYRGFLDRMTSTLSNLRRQDFSGGTSTRAGRSALIAILVAISIGVLLIPIRRIRLPSSLANLLRKRVRARTAPDATPSIEFYAKALDQLKRIGIHRSVGETPSEFCIRVAANHPQLIVLTAAFHRCRYGDQTIEAPSKLAAALDQLTDSVTKTIETERNK